MSVFDSAGTSFFSFLGLPGLWWIVAFILIALIAVLVVVVNFIYVEPDKYINVEWRFPLSPTVSGGHFIAVGWQQGIRAKVYGPGWHFVFLVHIFGKTTPHDLVKTARFAVVFAKDGIPLPIGQVISESDVPCDNFTDGEKFLQNGGMRGYQIGLLPPGTWAINQELFTLEEIDPVEIGTVPETFKDPPASGEQKTRLRAQIGIVNSFIGQEPGKVGGERRIVAEPPDFSPPKFRPDHPGHLNFQDLKAFLDGGGLKGIQEELVFTGKWAINPKAVDVKKELAPFVPPGSVGVIISNVGDEPADNDKEFIGINKAGESVFILNATAKNKRGILPETKGPGDHFIHPVAYRLIPADVTPRSVLLDGLPSEVDKFEKVSIVTSDGFTVPMQAELIYQVPPGNAPKVIAVGRSVEEFEEDIVAPFVDDISKRIGSVKPMASLFSERESLREEIETALKNALEKSFPIIEVSTFRIKRFDFEESPDAETRVFANLLARVANAAQEQLTIMAEMEVQRKRVGLELLKATADNQDIPAKAQLRADAAKLNKEAIDTIKDTLSGYIKELPEDLASKIMGVLGVEPGGLLDAVASLLVSVAKKNESKAQ